MLYEFLQTFGETPGFDMESLSSLDILQRALLCGSEAEEELLSVMTHLLAGLRHRRPRNSASQLAHDSAGPDDETGGHIAHLPAGQRTGRHEDAGRGEDVVQRRAAEKIATGEYPDT